MTFQPIKTKKTKISLEDITWEVVQAFERKDGRSAYLLCHERKYIFVEKTVLSRWACYMEWPEEILRYISRKGLMNKKDKYLECVVYYDPDSGDVHAEGSEDACAAARGMIGDRKKLIKFFSMLDSNAEGEDWRMVTVDDVRRYFQLVYGVNPPPFPQIPRKQMEQRAKIEQSKKLRRD